jgi:hypothetical protein
VGTGDLDGPREIWRGSSWSYQQAGIGLDDARGILYVLASNKVKACSLDDGSLRTVSDVKVSSLCMDAEGVLYGTSYAGLFRIDPASGKTTKLSTEPFPGKDHSPWGYMAVDPKRGKAYGHCRGDVYAMDLKTGKFSMLCGGGQSFAAGPFKEAGWYCVPGTCTSAFRSIRASPGSSA